jgi:hypothetical protein
MSGRNYYYIFGRIGGRMVAQGGFNNESKANDVASAITDWDDSWTVEAFKTIDLQKAKSMFRAKQSQSTGQLAPTLLPIRSKKVRKDEQYSQGVY